MVSVTRERGWGGGGGGGKKHPPLPYACTHVRGREGEKRGEKSPSPLAHARKQAHAGEEGRQGSRGERRERERFDGYYVACKPITRSSFVYIH